MEFSSYISVQWIYYLLTGLYALSVFSVIVVILSENRSPVKSLAWITVLLVVPLVGLILYFFFGRSIQKKRIISRRNQRKLKKNETSGFRPDYKKAGLSPTSIRQIKLGQALAAATYYEGNDVVFFNNGKNKFDALIDDINNARHYILVEYYIIDEDETGRKFRDALVAAAKRGVKVRLIYDHVGSFSASRKFWKSLREAGIEVYPFFRVAFPSLGTRINWRNHRKIVVIDGEKGYIGGMNIADRYLKDDWRDLHLRLEGPAVSALQYNFAVDWNFMGQPLIEEQGKPRIFNKEAPVGIQMVTSGPTGYWPNLSMMFQKAISNALRRVYVMTPYFLPDESLLKTLQTAALSHVDVRILIPQKPDSVIMRHASFSYISECLSAGIKIYLYEKGMMHSKALIIDDDIVSLGSTNFDFRSFEHNFEANLFIYDKEFNAKMVEEFREACANSTRVNPSEWHNRPLKSRMIESVVRLMAPVL